MEAKKTRVNVILLDCCRELLPHELPRASIEQFDKAAMSALNPRAPEVRLGSGSGSGSGLGLGLGLGFRATAAKLDKDSMVV